MARDSMLGFGDGWVHLHRQLILIAFRQGRVERYGKFTRLSIGLWGSSARSPAGHFLLVANNSFFCRSSFRLPFPRRIRSRSPRDGVCGSIPAHRETILGPCVTTRSKTTCLFPDASLSSCHLNCCGLGSQYRRYCRIGESDADDESSTKATSQGRRVKDA